MSETDPGDGECSKNHRIGRFKWVNYRVHTFIPQWNLKVQGAAPNPPPHTQEGFVGCCRKEVVNQGQVSLCREPQLPQLFLPLPSVTGARGCPSDVA